MLSFVAMFCPPVTSKRNVYFGFVLMSSKSFKPVSMMLSVPAVKTVSCGSSYKTVGTAFVTTTAHVALTLPTVAVMVALPAADAVTLPVSETLTMPDGDTLHVTFCVAPLGVMVAVNCADSSVVIVRLVLDSVMFVAATSPYVPSSQPWHCAFVHNPRYKRKLCIVPFQKRP